MYVKFFNRPLNQLSQLEEDVNAAILAAESADDELLTINSTLQPLGVGGVTPSADMCNCRLIITAVFEPKK